MLDPDASTHAGDMPVAVAGAELVMDHAGALLWPAERLLVVADLHLEKGSAFAARGRGLLPPYDTAETLRRLGALIARRRPRAVLALGDSFHDGGAGARMAAADRAALHGLAGGCEWIWIAGNHDRERPAGLPGSWYQELRIGPLLFRHEPAAGAANGEIAGHLHPVAKVSGRGGGVRRRCLATDGRRAVLPAFGAYAGGLNVCDGAFAPLFGTAPPTALMLGRARVYAVAGHRLLPDGPGLSLARGEKEFAATASGPL
jgi:DNA ligase-associated metallophosphoesterase